MSRRLIDKERSHFPRLAGIFVVAAISGYLTFLIPLHAVWQQWTTLVHSLISLLLIALLIPYIATHFNRTLATRRLFVMALGACIALALLVLTITGLHIIFFGQLEAKRWIYDTHIVSSFFVPGMLIAHLVFHRVSISKRRLDREPRLFPGIPSSTLGTVFLSIAASMFGIVLCTFAYNALSSAPGREAAVQPYEYSYGSHPFRPAQTEIKNGGFVEARQIAGSEQCGSCHKAITREWRESMHSLAASDITYVKNINQLVRKEGIAATRYCESCHAPVALLSGQLTKGGKHGGIPGTVAFREGVSCMGCHGIDKAVHLQGVGSYRFARANEYLFADTEGLLTTRIRNFLIRTHPQEHRENMARGILKNPKICATCHVQFMDKDINHWGWIKMQDEYTPWLNSRYSGQQDQPFAERQMTRCQDCHMSLIPSNDPSADAKGLIRSHRFPGGNTAIPYLTGHVEQMLQTMEFLQGGKIRIDIEEPRRADAIRGKHHLPSKSSAENEAPYYLYLGETTKLKIVVTNLQIGHNFPSGTTDTNEVWIHLRVTDAQNRAVYESGKVLKNNGVDSGAHFYRTIPIDRNGQDVWKHDLFNMVGDRYKNTIPPGHADIVEYRFTVPYWAKGPLSITTTLRYRKFNTKYANWVMGENAALLPIVDMAEDKLIIPLRIKPEAVSIKQGIDPS